MVKCPKCGADAVIRTLNDDWGNLHTCRNDSCHFVFNPEELAKKETKMKPDDCRKFIVTSMVKADDVYDIDYDVEFCTEAELLAELKETAKIHYEESENAFSVCVWDVENCTSTIYEYECEKTVQVTVTCY